jgi:hypothetical protein
MLTPFSLDQVNAALGTNLTRKEYNDRIQILRETEAFARESCVRSTAVSDDRASSPPATESASTRGREEIASWHGASGMVRAAQEASPLHLLADVAGRAYIAPRFAGAVPTLRPTEPISGSPHAFLPSPSQHDLLVGRGVGTIEQPSASDSSHPSSLVTLSDGSCLPIGYLDVLAPVNNSGYTSGIEGKGIDTDGPGGPNGTGLGTPQGHDGPTLSDRPAKRQRADREADGLCHGDPGRISAAEHAARQGEGQDESELNLFLEEMMEFPEE